MKFYFEEHPLKNSYIFLNADDSFETKNSDFWDFQISIEPLPVLLLNFHYATKTCIGIEGHLNINKCRKKTIHLNIIQKGILKVDNFSVQQDAYGMTYKLEKAKCYYDAIAKIFAVGKINDINEVNEIGTGQFVKIEDGKISCILIQF